MMPTLLWLSATAACLACAAAGAGSPTLNADPTETVPAVESDVVDDGQLGRLQAENAQLARRDGELETRVGRLRKRLADASGSKLTLEDDVDEVVALKAQVASVQKQNQLLEQDKSALLGTVQGMLKTNQTKTMEMEMQSAQQMKLAVEERSANERAGLEAQLKEAREGEASEKEVMKTLQDQTLDLQRQLEASRSEVGKLRHDGGALASDKESVMNTLRGVLRQNTKLQKDVADAHAQVKKADQEASVAVAAYEARKKAAVAAAKKKGNASAVKKVLRKQPKKQHGKKVQGARTDTVDPSDATAYMGDLRGIEEYVNRVHIADPVVSVSQDPELVPEPAPVAPAVAEEAPEVVPEAVPLAPAHVRARHGAKAPGFYLARWLGAGGATDGAGAPLSPNAELTPVDGLDPVATARALKLRKPATAPADEGDDDLGAGALLNQAEAALSGTAAAP